MATTDAPNPGADDAALDRAVARAYRRLLPLLFACYVVAYVDRTNVGLAEKSMRAAMPAFDGAVIGIGSGIFFLGYFLLEIPGSLLVERWSARRWISRIMVTWGLVAALTAFVKEPWQFYGARFLLGLAEAGFFPGVIVYLTHWFPGRERAKALSWFLVASGTAQILSPRLSYYLIRLGTTEMIGGVPVAHPSPLGLHGWQWMFIAWGLPAVALGLVVLAFLTDRPGQARWLPPEEREALEAALAREKARMAAGRPHMTVAEALANPKVLLLALAFFSCTTANYGVEIFMPKILREWYGPTESHLSWILMIPPVGSLLSQLFVGWNSDRTGERRIHTAIPMAMASAGLALSLVRGQPLWAMIALFTVVAIGTKAYLPAFWSLPSLFLTEAAAAGSIGLINSVGNLGGTIGPALLGVLETRTGSYLPGIVCLSLGAGLASAMIVLIGLGRRPSTTTPSPAPSPGPA